MTFHNHLHEETISLRRPNRRASRDGRSRQDAACEKVSFSLSMYGGKSESCVDGKRKEIKEVLFSIGSQHPGYSNRRNGQHETIAMHALCYAFPAVVQNHPFPLHLVSESRSEQQLRMTSLTAPSPDRVTRRQDRSTLSMQHFSQLPPHSMRFALPLAFSSHTKL